jgi:hypothetical protein
MLSGSSASDIPGSISCLTTSAGRQGDLESIGMRISKEMKRCVGEGNFCTAFDTAWINDKSLIVFFKRPG